MPQRECEVIGCLEAAVWAKTVQADHSLEDFLCHGCWLLLATKQPEQAAYYILCDADVRPQHSHYCSCAKQVPTGDTIVIQ